MSKKTLKYVLVLFIISCIFITSCNKAININEPSTSTREQNTNQISRDLEYLCSDECGGRQSGSEGNIKAGNYISNRFKEMAISPLNSDYQIPFEKPVASINKISLELIDTNKTVRSFTYGKDYIEISLDDIDIALPLYNKPVNTDCIVLTDNIKKVSEYKNNNHVKMIIIKKPIKYSKPSNLYSKENITRIYVAEETFNILQCNIGKTVQFNADISVHEKELNNIASIIEGESHDSALLISAHFDHVGSIDNPGSQNYLIWRGALDNASGVSTMLETARCLKNIYKDKKPPYDIIFCAFNNEENVWPNMGSHYFLEHIIRKYSFIFDINMDCLGNNDSSTLFIKVNKTAESMAASEKIVNSLKSQNVNVELYNKDIASDHRTFTHALCITTVSDLNKSNIHSLEDTPDKINISFLSEVARKLANSIGDTIGTIGLDKISYTINNTTSESTDMTSPSEFEKTFNCKLDFLNSKKSCINITTTPRIGILKTTDPTKLKPAVKDISDIHNTTFFMTDYVVSFTTYKTGSTKEMQLYKKENEGNETDNKSKAQQIRIGKYNYYVFTKKDDSKNIIIEFNDKNILIEVYITGSDINDFTSPKQYKDFFESNNLENFIDGMVKLFKERS